MQYQPIILCVDDYLPGLAVRRLILEQHGYKVLATHNGFQALYLARKYRLDLALLDYEMPGINGEQLACELRKISPGLRIVLFSCNPLYDLPGSIFEHVDSYIDKGTSPRQWLIEIDRISRRQCRSA